MRHLSTKTVIAMLSILALASGDFIQAEETPEPPTPLTETPGAKAFGKKENNLPLELYKKLTTKLRVLGGAVATEGTKMSKADAKSGLQADVKEQSATLIKALEASQVIHREVAAVVLRFSKEDDAKEGILKALGKSMSADPDKHVRQAAVGSVGTFKDASSVESLITTLKDADEGVRSIAIAALATIKDNRAGAPLLEVLKDDEDALVRMRAASALAKIKEPKTLGALLDALENEKDLRVRMAIAGAVRIIRGKDTPATKGVPETKQQKNTFADLSKEMKEVEDKLRGDRHDQAVQVAQTNIENKLTKIIKQLEKMQKKSGKGKGKKKKKKQGQKQKQSRGKGQKPGQSNSPLNDSKLSGESPRGALRAAEVSSTQDQWAKLPPQLREEMLQVYREGMPERWRKRLEAYYLSVAAEDGGD